MKKVFLISIVLISHLSIWAQGGTDLSLTLNTTLYNVERSDDHTIGKKLSTPFEISKKDGHLKNLKNENKELIWTYRIHIDGAKAVVPFFDNLVIEDGAKIRAYSPKTGKSTRYFYNNDNINTHSFALPAIKGKDIIIEASFPNIKAFNKFQLSISEVGALYSTAGFGDAPDCYANVHCSEANTWQDQVRSVAKYMTVSGSDVGYCSGALVNNTNQDCKNYFLSAQHCGQYSTDAEFGQFVFYFNYEANSCETPPNDNGLDQQTVVGCNRVSWSGPPSGQGFPTGTDFMLVELNTIPASYNVYYAGWNRANVVGTQGSGAIIQHPRADLKKISFWEGTVNPGGSSVDHLEVVCVATDNGQGIAEPNSSGSPIFDQNKLIIGDVTTGSDGCVSDYPNSTSIAGGGQFYYHWDSNGDTPDLQLKPWLDPTNSGVMSLDGKNQCSVGIEEKPVNHLQIEVYPNPSNEFITIKSDSPIKKINIYSISGKLVSTSHKSKEINISNLPSGVYIVEVINKNGLIAHNKLYKQ